MHCRLPRYLDDRRKKTIETLISLAEDPNPNSCYDDHRAEELLRSQSTPEELREPGAKEATIQHIFPAPERSIYTVRVEARFEAAHYLREYRGISEPLHGHSYKVEADLASRGGGIDSDSIAVDFISAKQKLEALATLGSELCTLCIVAEDQVVKLEPKYIDHPREVYSFGEKNINVVRAADPLHAFQGLFTLQARAALAAAHSLTSRRQ